MRKTKTIYIKRDSLLSFVLGCWYALSLCCIHTWFVEGCRWWHDTLPVCIITASRTQDAWQLVKVTIVLGDVTTCHPDAGEMSSLGGATSITRFGETSTMAGWWHYLSECHFGIRRLLWSLIYLGREWEQSGNPLTEQLALSRFCT